AQRMYGSRPLGKGEVPRPVGSHRSCYSRGFRRSGRREFFLVRAFHFSLPSIYSMAIAACARIVFRRSREGHRGGSGRTTFTEIHNPPLTVARGFVVSVLPGGAGPIFTLHSLYSRPSA